MPHRGTSLRRRRKFFGLVPEEADLGVRGGGQAEKWPFVLHFVTPRSRQDASIECRVGGSKRPSSGCNGVHVVCLKPLFRRSLLVALGLRERGFEEAVSGDLDGLGRPGSPRGRWIPPFGGSVLHVRTLDCLLY